MSDYEPPAEMVEALAKELQADGVMDSDWRFTPDLRRDQWKAVATRVLRRQREREQGLLEVLRFTAKEYQSCDYGRVARNALAAHAKLDAPKVPTLLEAAANIAASAFKTSLSGACADKDTFIGISLDRLKALKAAVEREERKP